MIESIKPRNIPIENINPILIYEEKNDKKMGNLFYRTCKP